MRLVTFEINGRRRLGAEWKDRILDLQAADQVRRLMQGDAGEGQSIPGEMVKFLRAGNAAIDAARATITFMDALPGDRSSGLSYAREAVTLKAPLTRAPKIICLGLNYRDHA